MDGFDWAQFSWFPPLFAGAALTAFFGWLDSTVKYRRDRSLRAEVLKNESEERRRIEGREHAQRALTLVSDIRDDFETKRFSNLPTLSMEWDGQRVRALRDAGLLIPEERVRSAVADATNIVTASSVLADAEGWETVPAELQRGAVARLRVIVAAYLRGDDLPADPLEWVTTKAAALQAEWRRAVEREQGGD
jgi:hypothetical protein